jgi:hypothetical protein
VYFVMAKKQGKNRTRALVIDDAGVTYTMMIPTWPFPKFGQAMDALRLDLEVVSVVPAEDLLKAVRQSQ